MRKLFGLSKGKQKRKHFQTLHKIRGFEKVFVFTKRFFKICIRYAINGIDYARGFCESRCRKLRLVGLLFLLSYVTYLNNIKIYIILYYNILYYVL